MTKNTKSQLEYVGDYFKSRPNEEIQTTKAKAYIEKKYLTETGKRFEDPDRAIRTLYQKGEIIKIRDGLYKYDPSYSGKDKTFHDFPEKIKKQILKRDNYRCVFCKFGKKEKAELHVDHKVPRDRGGPSTLENGQTLCSRCNFLKKNMSMNSLGKKIFDDLLKKSMKNKNKEMIKIAKEFLALFKKYNLS